MEHSEAICLMAVEKYLLNELTPELREGFEEHFFECQECALDVRAGNALIEHSKTVLSASNRPQSGGAQVVPAPRPWLAWLRPAFVLPVIAVLLVVVGYQNLVSYPRLRDAVARAGSPQVLASLYLTSGTLQGTNDRVITVGPDSPFLLMVDIPSEERFSAYVCELYSPAGVLEGTFRVSAEAAKNTVPVQVPPQPRNSGTYRLVVHGIVSGQAQAVDIGSFPFELQVRQ